MDLEILVNSLVKDELTYEVTIRSETPTSTVPLLRKQLKQLLIECPSEIITETEFDCGSEVKVIIDKIKELQAKLSEKTITAHCLSRCRGLVRHLHHRLLRVASEDPAVLLQKAELSDTIGFLLSVAEKFFVSTKAQHPDQCDTQIESLPVVTVAECSGDKNVAKWNLRFNGTTDPRSFLERVDELQISYGVSDGKLFNSAAQLFSEQGLLWYRGIKNQVSSWAELKSLLLEEFDPVDYEYRLMGEIRSRTQGLDEPTHIYFSVMACLFNRLSSPLPEEKQLEILLHNIRPYFSRQLALLDITSISDLKSKCRKLESARQRSNFFVEPTGSNLLSQEFCYKGKAKQVNYVATQNIRRPPTTSQQYNLTPSSNQRVCFKCGKGNHNFKLCSVTPVTPRNIRCFGCGKVGFIVSSCPNCNKGTSSKGSHQSKN